MKGDFDPEAANKLIQAATSIREARYALAAMGALQLHDWILGVRKEVRLVHCARWTSIKLAYLLCRYYTLLIWPVILWSYLPGHSFELCQRSGKPVHVLLTPCQFFPQAVMAMRAYAFSGRENVALYILAPCFLVLFGFNIWAWCFEIDFLPWLFFWALKDYGLTGCFANWGGPVMGVRIGISMLGAVLMDLVSLVTVLVYCKKKNDTRGGSLGRYFVSQGLGAFVLVTIVNALAAIVFFKPPSYNTGIGLPLALVLPNVVACRVILKLRCRVSCTDTVIQRQHSDLVHRAFAPEAQDLWLMDNDSE